MILLLLNYIPIAEHSHGPLHLKSCTSVLDYPVQALEDTSEFLLLNHDTPINM